MTSSEHNSGATVREAFEELGRFGLFVLGMALAVGFLLVFGFGLIALIEGPCQ